MVFYQGNGNSKDREEVKEEREEVKYLNIYSHLQEIHPLGHKQLLKPSKGVYIEPAFIFNGKILGVLPHIPTTESMGC